MNFSFIATASQIAKARNHYTRPGRPYNDKNNTQNSVAVVDAYYVRPESSDEKPFRETSGI